jgi:hypothetical protein
MPVASKKAGQAFARPAREFSSLARHHQGATSRKYSCVPLAGMVTIFIPW